MGEWIIGNTSSGTVVSNLKAKIAIYNIHINLATKWSKQNGENKKRKNKC